MSNRTQSPTLEDKLADGGTDDAVWTALGHPARRRILDLLRERSRNTNELCSDFPVSRFAVMKHLNVLVGAGLVIVERRGRERMNHLNPVPIQAIYRRWIRPFEILPSDRLLRLKERVESAATGTQTRQQDNETKESDRGDDQG